MQQRSEETRTRIIESAIKLFSKQGYNASSVDDICLEAGVSKGAFYHHFKTKQALFIALLDEWLKNIDHAIEASKDNTVPQTFMQMTEAFPYFFETASENLPMFLEFWLQASRDKKIWEASIAPIDAITDISPRSSRKGWRRVPSWKWSLKLLQG